VDDLDAPWKVSSDATGEQYLLVRNGTPVTVPLVNVINELAEQQAMVRHLRRQMDKWGSQPVSAVPQQFSHLTELPWSGSDATPHQAG
jgi:hypothetical protein